MASITLEYPNLDATGQGVSCLPGIWNQKCQKLPFCVAFLLRRLSRLGKLASRAREFPCMD